MNAESRQIKYPILVFLYGLYSAALCVICVIIPLIGFEIFTQIVIWEPYFSNQRFFMIPYPLHFNILSIELFFYLFLFFWLIYSVPVYFIAKKRKKEQLLNKEDNSKDININQRIDNLEQSVEKILKHLDDHAANYLSDN